VHNVALFAFQQPSSQSIAEIVLEPKTHFAEPSQTRMHVFTFLQSNFTLQNYNMLINTGDALT
jgi:hypothetical protein